MRNYANEEIYKRKRKREKITEKIKLIIVILIAIIVAYNIALIIQSVVNPNKTPSFLGVKTFAIISGSMEPQIQIGDIVVVKEVEEQNLQEGDVITFRRNNEIITHRIQEIKEVDGQKQYVTKGDNNVTEDLERVLFNDIEGKVVKIIPYIGNVVMVLKNKITILVILLIFFVMYMLDTKKQNKKMMREQKKELLNKRRE